MRFNCKYRIILSVQLVLIILMCVFDSNRTISLPAKLITSALFVLSAFMLWRGGKSAYNRLAAFGMLFCFLGDIATSKLLPGGLILAMLFFGIAHVLFIIAYVKTIHKSGARVINGSFFMAMAVYCIYYLIMWYVSTILAHKDTVFTVGSLIYGLLVSLMAVTAWSLRKADKTYWPAAVGGALFLFSDSIIAFSGAYKLPFANIIILVTYYISLFGIIYAGNKTSAESIRQEKA